MLHIFIYIYMYIFFVYSIIIYKNIQNRIYIQLKQYHIKQIVHFMICDLKK